VPLGRHLSAMTHRDSRLRHNRWIWATCAAVVVYFALSLIPPGSRTSNWTLFYFAYPLSLPIALIILFSLGACGGIGLLRSWMRHPPRTPRHQAYLVIACVGVASFVIVLGIARTLPRPLPTGSHIQSFDRAAWHAPHSAAYVDGDITPRQKMLSDVVKSILPGRTRTELEDILGSSLDTAYFKSTGRDLIYILGPQRDAYFTIDSEWLLIWLDKGGRFERYAIMND
jgi:hypothetical protein